MNQHKHQPPFPPDVKQQPGPGAQQRTLGAGEHPLPLSQDRGSIVTGNEAELRHAPPEAEHLRAAERRARSHVRDAHGDYDDGLQPQEDDLDALVLGPTGSDGDIGDPDVARVFKEEQIGHGAESGRDHAWRLVRAHAGLDPELSVGDLDASLEDAQFTGDESPAGSMPSPDANDVEDIGRAMGMHYQDNEPLDMEGKMVKRDDDRWELDPASSEDWAARKHHEERRVKRSK